MKLSNQAMGAIMMALQRSLLKQEDIVPILNDFIFRLDDHEMLMVENPPSFQIEAEEDEQEDLEFKATTGSD